jgi:alanyl-tRNA synthetase
MAWDLLTNVYKLDPGRMYVTYYAGGNNIPMDIETRDIWKSLGWV